MAWPIILTLDGTPYDIQDGTLDLVENVDAYPLLNAGVKSEDGMFRVGQDAVTTLSDNGVQVFGGYTVTPNEAGLADAGAGILNTFDATGWKQLTQRRVVTKSYAADMTTKQIMQDLHASYLDVFGVTFDAGIPDGATWDAISFTRQYLVDVLNILCEGTTDEGWSFDITPLKAFTAGPFDALAAPWSITEATPNHIGDIRVSRMREDYGNRVLIEGGTGEKPITDEQHFGDGAVRAFSLDFQVKEFVGALTVNIDGAEVSYPVGRYGIDDMEWTAELFTEANGHATYTVLHQRADQPLLDSDDWVKASYVAIFPRIVVVTDSSAFDVFGGVGPWEKVVPPYTSIFDLATLTALAAVHLAKSLLIKMPANFTTITPGLHVRHLLPITWPKRDLDGFFFVSSIRAGTYAEGQRMQYVVQAHASMYRGTYISDWKKFRGNSGGGGGGTFSVTTGSGGSATPSASTPSLGGSLDVGITGATTKKFRTAAVLYGNHYAGRVAIPIIGGRVRVAGETFAPVIKDNAGNIVSAIGSIASPVPITSSTDDVWQPLTPFTMEAGKTYNAWGLLGAASHTGFGFGYVYIS